MSKSKGNVIDPLTKMSQYGTDALRFTLASMASPGRDIKLSENRIEGYRNFANKIWNAARFILMHADGPTETRPIADRPFVDQWILSRLNRVTAAVTARLEEYRFDQAAGQLYQHSWHEYCDWYLELIKPALQGGDSPAARSTRATMLHTFEHLQRLLHPFMPFLTEEIWANDPPPGRKPRPPTFSGCSPGMGERRGGTDVRRHRTSRHHDPDRARPPGLRTVKIPDDPGHGQRSGRTGAFERSARPRRTSLSWNGHHRRSGHVAGPAASCIWRWEVS